MSWSFPDLEARERKAAEGQTQTRVPDVKAEERLRQEIERLRKEGSRLLEEEQERLREELRTNKESSPVPETIYVESGRC